MGAEINNLKTQLGSWKETQNDTIGKMKEHLSITKTKAEKSAKQIKRLLIENN